MGEVIGYEPTDDVNKPVWPDPDPDDEEFGGEIEADVRMLGATVKLLSELQPPPDADDGDDVIADWG